MAVCCHTKRHFRALGLRDEKNRPMPCSCDNYILPPISKPVKFPSWSKCEGGNPLSHTKSVGLPFHQLESSGGRWRRSPIQFVPCACQGLLLCRPDSLYFHSHLSFLSVLIGGQPRSLTRAVPRVFTRQNAKVRGIEWALTREEVRVLTKQNCHYCGVEPRQVSHNPRLNGDYIYTGIDRVDNDRRYESGNVVPCCGDCNFAKRKKTVEQFKVWGHRFYDHFLREGDLDKVAFSHLD